jgi:DNA-binding LytR/AlgR family response regulator
MSFIPKELPIVFTTAYSEYAIESYEYHVIDYLLKPITFNRFMKAVGKAEEQISGALQKKSSLSEQAMIDEGYFFVRADKKMIKINFDDILYFEAVKEYICIHTENQKVLVYKRMKDLAEKLPEYFIRVHNSYIINCKCIKKIEGNIVVIGNLDIPLGVSYRNKFLEFIQSRAL